MLHKCSNFILISALFFTASSFAQQANTYVVPVNNQQPYPAQPYNQGYVVPQQNYNQGYVVPQQNYNQGYVVPQQNYNQGYVVPQQNYNQGYVVPQQNYNQGYVVPQQSYNQGYVAPQQNYNQANYNQPYPPPQPEEPKKSGRSLQTLNFALPIENETWEVDDSDIDWSSIGYEFNWSRYKISENKLTSVFGLSIGYVAGDTKGEKGKRGPDLDGLDFNLKFGWGMAPLSDNFVLAFHLLMGFDIKALEGDYKKVSETETYNYGVVSYPTEPEPTSTNFSATYIDAILGGDLIAAYLFSEAFAVVGGIDVTTNVLGLGVYSYEYQNSKESEALSYMFSGINIVPHIGIAFIF